MIIVQMQVQDDQGLLHGVLMDEGLTWCGRDCRSWPVVAVREDTLPTCTRCVGRAGMN